MTVQIVITGDNGRQAAVEIKSFIANVVDLFGATASDGPAQIVVQDNTFVEPEATPEPAPAAEPVEAVEEAPKKRGRSAKKAAEPKPEPEPAPEEAEEVEPEDDGEEDDAPVEDDLIAGYAVTEAGFRAAFRAWAATHDDDYVMEHGAGMIGAAKIPDMVAKGEAAIAEALRRVVADTKA